MSTFDLHMHPVFKRAICQFEDEYPTKRDAGELAKHFDLAHDLAEWADENIFHILESQCCVDQLTSQKGPVFGVAAISPIERFFTHRSGVFGKLLNGSFTDPFDKTYMNRIREGEISYYQLYLKELGLYRKLQEDDRIRWITRKDNKKALGATDKINVVLGMEGGHALCRSLIGRPGTKDTKAKTTADGHTAWDKFTGEPMHPADGLKELQQSLWNDGIDLFYLTLTHLSHIGDQFLATHAYGMKMLDTPESYPQGNGISEMGKEVVRTAYTLNWKEGTKAVNAPVMIDMKHMGLKSRQDLYRLRADMGDKKLPPLLATHMGVTGYSVAGWKAALIGNTPRVKEDPRNVGFTIKRQDAGEWGVLNKKFNFNAWSINLMDDDIVKILESGGLIGISLDVRILGWQDALHKDDIEEFMSPEDFRCHFPQEYARIFHKPLGVESMTAEEDWFKPAKEERHPLALCFNILHVASVGMIAGIKDAAGDSIDPWDHICIGSDFDGLIDPLKNVRDAGQVGELRPLLMRWLPEAEKAYRKELAGPEVLAGQDLSALVEKLLHTNGREFLRTKWI